MKNAVTNREKISDIKRRLDFGIISYEQAKEEATPIIAEINATAKDLAKKYGMRPQLVSFGAIIR